ncbi:MAG: response regulator transcription factor [Ktedonobacterales bacterium]|nr:response regulator transcription factor [Ktedonobacterales bacterium]
MRNILIIDDDPAVTSVLKRGLSYEGFSTHSAATGPDGLTLAREFPPDLVILDLMLPGLDGFEVLRRLRAADALLPVVLLSAKDMPTDQVRGLDLGADDYVIKPFTFEILVARVHALLRRQQAEHPPLLRYADLTLDTGSHIVRRGARVVPLTALEFRVLHEFLLHPQQVLAKEQLLERVWGYDFGGNGNVVETYVKQLRQKLEVGNEQRLLYTVRNVGYVLREE